MWVKICGVRDVATAVTAADAGADAIGLNFYAQSPRVVAPETAAEIVAALRGRPTEFEPVGVFVNQTFEEVTAIGDMCRLRTIQLHGDEAPEQVARLAARFRVIKAFRVGDEGLEDLSRYLAACKHLTATAWACLVDAKVEGQFGGTGHKGPWEILRLGYRAAEWPPLVLAGGLTPGNVGEAIRAAAPWGVDVASGVESALACKDATMVRQFVQNARNSS